MRTLVATVVLLASLQAPTARAGGFGSGGYSSGSYAAQASARIQQQRQQQALAALTRAHQAAQWSNAASQAAAVREYQARVELTLQEARDQAFIQTAARQRREARPVVEHFHYRPRLGPSAVTGPSPSPVTGGFGAYVQRPVREIRTDFGARPVAPAGTLMAAARAQTQAPMAMARRDRRSPRGHRRPERTYGQRFAPDRRPHLTSMAARPQQLDAPRFEPVHVRAGAGAARFQPLRVRARTAHVAAQRSVRPAPTVKRTQPFHPPRFKLVTGQPQ
jgi:hypothetical protein